MCLGWWGRSNSPTSSPAANRHTSLADGWNRKRETDCTCKCPQTPASRVLSQRPRRRAKRSSGGAGTSHSHCSINTRYQERQLCCSLKQAVRSGYWRHLGNGANEGAGKVETISQGYSKSKIVPFNCCSLTLKVKHSCKIPPTADLVHFPDTVYFFR